MKRKIVIETCKDWGLALEITKEWPDTVFYCNHELNGNAPEKIESDTIPEWCQLEEDE